MPCRYVSAWTIVFNQATIFKNLIFRIHFLEKNKCLWDKRKQIYHNLECKYLRYLDKLNTIIFRKKKKSYFEICNKEFWWCFCGAESTDRYFKHMRFFYLFNTKKTKQRFWQKILFFWSNCTFHRFFYCTKDLFFCFVYCYDILKKSNTWSQLWFIGIWD